MVRTRLHAPAAHHTARPGFRWPPSRFANAPGTCSPVTLLHQSPPGPVLVGQRFSRIGAPLFSFRGALFRAPLLPVESRRGCGIRRVHHNYEIFVPLSSDWLTPRSQFGSHTGSLKDSDFAEFPCAESLSQLD